MATPNPLLDRILTTGAPPEHEGAERILAGAIQHAEDFGLRRFTIDDVARRVGVSRVTVYRHFPKKERLVEAVVLHEVHRFLRAIDTAVEPCETLEDKLVEGFVFAMAFLRKHRLLNRLLRTEPELVLPALTVHAEPILAAAREFIAGFARREAQDGKLPLTGQEIDAVSELLARAVLSFVLTPESVLGLRTEAEIRHFADHYLATTLRALSGLPRQRPQ